MKKYLFSITFILTALAINAQQNDKVIGTWLTQDGDSKVTVSKNVDKHYDGAIVWLKEPKRESGEE